MRTDEEPVRDEINSDARYYPELSPTKDTGLVVEGR
jgi:hypothetical protein